MLQFKCLFKIILFFPSFGGIVFTYLVSSSTFFFFSLSFPFKPKPETYPVQTYAFSKIGNTQRQMKELRDKAMNDFLRLHKWAWFFLLHRSFTVSPVCEGEALNRCPLSQTATARLVAKRGCIPEHNESVILSNGRHS